MLKPAAGWKFTRRINKTNQAFRQKIALFMVGINHDQGPVFKGSSDDINIDVGVINPQRRV